MRDFLKSEKNKRLFIAFGVTFMVTLVTFTIIFISYSQKLKSTSDSLSSITNTTVTSNNEVIEEESSLASSSEDKDVNEVINDVISNIELETSSVQGETSNTISVDNVETVENKETEESTNEIKEVDPVSFIAPVSGEIITDYAEESLIFSNTLQEWTTHLGIDIKADKASIVVASEDGVIKSIKNDPRYGLTITISHNDNFETVYSNLLSSEFVNEGDEVNQGQTIGTVGESASFEIAEVPHLHFEMYKDGSVVNPTLYLEDV